ncbi:hypothetical protein [Vibrio sp. L3-7]|nr:hypothetical protein [Vibrio sp. L3-7]MCF7506098.1 hypothetical protein [Vibrio sp. L3-7]
MTDTALVGGICVDIKKSMSRFADAYGQFRVFVGLVYLKLRKQPEGVH